MATILLAWELGSGSGHTILLASLVKGLRAAGCRVVVALRELPRAKRLSELEGVTLLQAPYRPPSSSPTIAVPRTYADVLCNVGFADPAELAILTDAWGHLIDFVAPDVVLCEHAPTALLAAQGRPVKRVVSGAGFFCPPDCSPLADFRPWMPPDSERLQQAERHVLGCMNQVLARRGVEPLDRATEIFGQADETFLTTFAEFDHYPERQALTAAGCRVAGDSAKGDSPIFASPRAISGALPSSSWRRSGTWPDEEAKIGTVPHQALTPGPSPGRRGEESALTAGPESSKGTVPFSPTRKSGQSPGPSPGGRGEIRYRGPWSSQGGGPPVWPEGKGKRVYAYLAPFPGLPRILGGLRATGCPTIVYGQCGRQLENQFAAPHMRFEAGRLDLRQAAAECDVAVLNSTFVTSIELLLAGKPILQVPIYTEHGITAMNTVRLGAGLMAFPDGADRTQEQLQDLLHAPKYTAAARAFAAKYAGFSAESEIALASQRLIELAGSGEAQRQALRSR